ncbi:MAG: hypothetical protein AAB383_02070 [Patescibacteria group bacterium]
MNRTLTAGLLACGIAFEAGAKGVKQGDDITLYTTMVREMLILTNKALTVGCPGLTSGIASNLKSIPFGKEVPVGIEILTHYKDLLKKEIVGHTVIGSGGIEEARIVYDISNPGMQSCFQFRIDMVNSAMSGFTEKETCNVHEDIAVEKPRSVSVFASCGPRALPNANSDRHFFHHPGTTSRSY